MLNLIIKKNIYNFKLKNCVYLDYDLYSTGIIHLSKHVKLAELLQVVVIEQVIVKSYGQHTYLEEAMKSSQPEFYANASLLSQILCPKHYISMYLGEYPAKL